MPELLQRLDHFVDQLQRLAAETPGIVWDQRPAPETWSLVEIVCHLRDVELEVHQPRLHTMLEEESPFISGASPDAWAETRGYRTESGPAALADFVHARRATVRFLAALTPDDWERRGRHAFLGTTTLQELVFLIVSHDEAHWPQFLSLLHVLGEQDTPTGADVRE